MFYVDVLEKCVRVSYEARRGNLGSPPKILSLLKPIDNFPACIIFYMSFPVLAFISICIVYCQ